MRKLIMIFLTNLLRLADLLCKKDPNLWVIGNAGHNDSWNGNQKYLYKYIRNNCSNLKLYVLLRKQNNLENIDTIIYANTIKGIKTVLKAKVFLVHHGTGDIYYNLKKNRNRIVVNLWHGINLRGASFTDYYYYYRREGQKLLIREREKYDYVLATSKTTKLAFCANFQLLPERVLITGYPRNDILAYDSNQYEDDSKEIHDQLNGLIKGKKFVLYAPTWREAKDWVYSFTTEEVELIKKVLKKNNAILGIRAHFNSPFKNPDRSEFIDVGFNFCHDMQILLKEADVLITDYSSSWVDYLLLDRPVIGFCYDFDQYLKSHMLIYDYKNIFPGKICYNSRELVQEIERILSCGREDTEVVRYNVLRNLFHHFGDNQSSERVYDLILKVINGEKIPVDNL